MLAAVIGAMVFLANKDWQASDKESPEDLAAAFDAHADAVIPRPGRPLDLALPTPPHPHLSPPPPKWVDGTLVRLERDQRHIDPVRIVRGVVGGVR